MRQPLSKLNDPPDEQSQGVADQPMVLQASEKPGVLVVDDEHMVRIMVQLGLERNGFDVWLARNGREAIDFYRRHAKEIAVVLLDVGMPGLDGLETLEVLHELNPEVVACFMSAGTYEPKELLQRGAAYVIAKPFRPDDLANLLRLIAHRASAGLLTAGRVCQA